METCVLVFLDAIHTVCPHSLGKPIEWKLFCLIEVESLHLESPLAGETN